MLGMAALASRRCLMIPTQLTTTAGRMSLSTAETRSGSSHVHVLDDAAVFEESHPARHARIQALPYRAPHVGKALAQHLEHLVTEHALAAEHENGPLHLDTSARAHAM